MQFQFPGRSFRSKQKSAAPRARTRNDVNMSFVARLLKFLPEPSFFRENKSIKIKRLYCDVIEGALKPLRNGSCSEVDSICAKRTLVRIGVVYDLVYACLHTGEWHAVPREEREVFTIVCYLRVRLKL